MWGYIRNLALRTALTLACLAMLTVNRTEPPDAAVPQTDAAKSAPVKSWPDAGLIAMTVIDTPPLESRLPRGTISLVSAAAGVEVAPFTQKPAAEPAEILLFQAIIAQAEVGGQRQGGPARSSGGPGGGSSRRAPDPDLPPEFDPNYDNWQKDADIKLNDEKSRAHGKEHPHAIANPESYLVICLGGCRPSSNEIVYRVSKTAAAAAVIAQRRMETTAAGAKGGKGEKAEAGEQNSVACIAGCYANQDISPDMKPRRVAVAPIARPMLVAARVSTGKMLSARSLVSAHRISAETQGYIAKKRVTNVIRETQTWRTKIVFATRKAARLAAKRDRITRAVATKISRSRGAKRNTIVTEASGFIF